MRDIALLVLGELDEIDEDDENDENDEIFKSLLNANWIDE